MSARTSTSPVPSAHAVRELLEGLLGRDVDVATGAPPVNPAAEDGAVVALYVDAMLGLRALALLDLPLACWSGAAIALVPARLAAEAVESQMITQDLLDNASEILNVAASLFNLDGAPHVRLYEVHAPRQVLPPDVQQKVLAYVPRIDLTVDVAGYGEGRLSILALP